MVQWLSMALFAAAGTRIAVLPTQLDATAQGKVPAMIDDLVLAAVQEASGAKVIGEDDIQALLGFERQRDLLSCDDATCIAEIGGALGVDKLVAVKIGWVGDEWVVTSKVIDIHKSDVERRSSDFVSGDAKALLKQVPRLVAKLFGAPAPVTPAAAADAPPKRGPCTALDECTHRCDAGERDACHDLGWRIIWGTSEPQRGVAVFRRLCDDDDLQGCNDLGWVTLNGLGTAKSDTEAHFLFQRACAGPDGRYCDGLAWLAADGRAGVAKNEARAVELFTRACAAGSTQGCYGHGWMLADARGTARNERRAVELFTRACAENAFFCDGLGWMKHQGRGTLRNDGEALVLFERSCGSGHGWGCFGQATLIAAGAGGPKDAERIASLKRVACERGVAPACAAR